VLGAVKFDIPNQFGIYLHDTSQKELLQKDVRLYSGGCIRLEDAERLGEWLFGHRLQASSDDPDITIPLGKPVPVYVTYLTAMPDGSAVTFLNDVYGRDGERMASSQTNGSGSTAAVR
jgi:murein L,D-transpeptidase YcbB/YkuD